MRKLSATAAAKSFGVYGLNWRPSALLKQRAALDMADASESAVIRPRLPQGMDGGEGGTAGVPAAPLLLRPRPPPPPLTEQEIVTPLPQASPAIAHLRICFTRALSRQAAIKLAEEQRVRAELEAAGKTQPPIKITIKALNLYVFSRQLKPGTAASGQSMP
jgi:hypothetical protein